MLLHRLQCVGRSADAFCTQQMLLAMLFWLEAQMCRHTCPCRHKMAHRQLRCFCILLAQALNAQALDAWQVCARRSFPSTAEVPNNLAFASSVSLQHHASPGFCDSSLLCLHVKRRHDLCNTTCTHFLTPVMDHSITLLSVPNLQVEVYDNRDGTYSLIYNLPTEGQWVLRPAVNNAAVRQQDLTLQAEQPPVQARDITFTLQQPTGGIAACGDGCRVLIQVIHHPVPFDRAHDIPRQPQFR